MKLTYRPEQAQEKPQNPCAYPDLTLGGGSPESEQGQNQNQDKQKKPENKKRKKGVLKWLFCAFMSLFTVMAFLAVGLGAFIYSWASKDLPDISKITKYKAAQTTTIYARDGSLIGFLAHERRFVVSLKEMPEYLPKAFMAIEDSSFYEHPGINIFAIVRAFLVNFERGTKSQGGSTITQQLVKQLLLSSERSYSRKIKEAILATKLEQELSKEEILALYLNYIYLGQHSYGVESASRTYFSKPAASLTLAEAALIAGMPQAPSRYNPFRHPKEAKQRQMEVLGRLKVLKWISQEQYEQAINEPLAYCSLPEGVAVDAQKWYFEEVRRVLIEFFTKENLQQLGIQTDKSGEDYVYEAGLIVETAMDPIQQRLASDALRQGLVTVDRRQGWRGPVKTLVSEKEREDFLLKQNFDPNDFASGKWALGVVTKSGNEILVDLGNGYKGTISPSNRSLLNTISRFSSRRNGKILEGDVIWVSLLSEGNKKQQAKYGKKNQKGQEAIPESAPVPTIQPGVSLKLKLQQEPLVQGALVSIEPQSGDVVALVGGYQFGDSHFNRATQARRQPGSTFKPIVYSAALDEGFTPTSVVLDAPISFPDKQGKIWTPKNSDGGYRGNMPLAEALIKSLNVPTVRLARETGIGKVIKRAKALGLDADFPAGALAVSLGSVGVSPMNLTQAYAAFANQGVAAHPRIITRIKDSKGNVLLDQPTESWQAVSPQNAYQITTLLQQVVSRGTGTRAQISGLNIAGKTGTTNDTHDVWFIGYTPYLCTGIYVGYDQVSSLGKYEQGGRTAAPIFKSYRSKADAYYKDSPKNFVRPAGIVMAGGYAYQGSVSNGRSASEGDYIPEGQIEIPTGATTPGPHIGEDTLQQLF